MEAWPFGDVPNLRASRACRPNKEEPQARCHRPLGHQLLYPRHASRKHGWDSARNTRKSALSLFARTRILARADAYRPDPVAYGARRFQNIASLLDAACGSVMDTPLGHLLGDYMLALERHLPAVTESDFPQLTNAVGAMIAAAVAPSAERIAVAKSQVDFGRMSGCGRPSAGTCERRR